ncbi:MAG TPA: hypothetical protein VJI74_03715, partial [Candidatus Paceibacterota bacterium]
HGRANRDCHECHADTREQSGHGLHTWHRCQGDGERGRRHGKRHSIFGVLLLHSEKSGGYR